MGFGGKPLARRTPTILNLAWTELLFWDGRAEGLEAQAVEPIISVLEMNQSMDKTIGKDFESGLASLKSLAESDAQAAGGLGTPDSTAAAPH